MKILHVYKDYYPVVGGIENHLRQVAEAQAAAGHAVSVLATSRTRHTHIEHLQGVRVIFAARLATVASTPLSLALPLALGRGAGAELRQPLGITIVGGLIFSQMLTLYTTPVIYLYLDRLRLWSKRMFGSGEPAIEPRAAHA